MKRIGVLLAALLAAAAAVAACGSNTSSTSSTSTMSSAAASSPAASRNAADVMFTQTMIPHHEQAIVMAELAATRAGSPTVKHLATRIRTAQAPEIAQMTGWLGQWGEPTIMPSTVSDSPSGGMMNGYHGSSSTLGMMSTSQMSQLRTLSGRALDRAFLTEMTIHHQGAIRMARIEARTGRHPAVRQLAKNVETSQTAEIASMAAMLRQP